MSAHDIDPTPAVDLSQEAGTGALEIALIALMAALAAAYLWRTYFRRKRKGGGCASCGSAAQCPMQPGQEAKQGAATTPTPKRDAMRPE